MRYAVLDCETTGVRKGDRIVELAAAVVDGDRIVESVYAVLNPGCEIPLEASAVHGWTDARVAGAQKFDKALAQSLLTLLDCGGPIYVHNVQFDRDTILLPEFERVAGPSAALAALPWSCTLKMCRELWPGDANDLGAVAARLNVEFAGRQHLAANDVDVLRRIVEQVVHRYAYRGHTGQLVKAQPTPMAAPVGSDELLLVAGQRAAEFLSRVKLAQEWAAGLLVCDDDDEQMAHEGLARVKKLQSEAEAARKSVVEPVKQIGTKIDTLFRENIARPCDEARARIESLLSAYAAAKLKAQREAEAAARAKLEAERAEAARIAAEARRQELELQAAEAKRVAEAQAAELQARRAGDAAKLLQLQAEQAAAAAAAEVERARLAAEQAEQAAKVQDAVAEVVTASEPVGPVKSQHATGGYKTRWVATIVDPAKVPDLYWRPDLEAVQRAVDQGAREIPGCAVVEEVVVANRRRG